MKIVDANVGDNGVDCGNTSVFPRLMQAVMGLTIAIPLFSRG